MTTTASAPVSTPTAPRLVRPRRGRGRVLAGVCAALADRFGWNPTVVRILAIASLLLPGPQLIFYIVAWIAIPAER